MSAGLYGEIAGVYDLLNSHIDYSKWADYIERVIEKFKKAPTKLMLDLGCGTGRMTFEMRRRGYDMTGVDISPEMLSEASERALAEGARDILWLCQDMCSFELYGTVDAVVCCLDSLNHLTKSGELERCFKTVHNYLVPDGLFIFDMNTPYKFENVYAERDYILECDGLLAAWQNEYNKKSRICDFYISVFSERSDGSYSREDCVQRERCYSERYVKGLLAKCGFELLSFSGDYGFDAPKSDDERWYVCARCIK